MTFDTGKGLKKEIFAATLLLQENAQYLYLLLDETPVAESGELTEISNAEYRNYLETLLLLVGSKKADPTTLLSGSMTGRLQYQPLALLQRN